MGYLGELGDSIGLTGGLARYRSVVVAGATGVAERAQVGSDPSFRSHWQGHCARGLLLMLLEA